MSANDKTMQRGGALHTILEALPMRSARTTGEIAEATGYSTHYAHAYLQTHEKRGNVSAERKNGRVKWSITTRGRAARKAAE